MVGALGPLEDRRAHAVPGVALGAAPVPADTVEAAVIALIAPAGIADAGQECTQRIGLRRRFHTQAELGIHRRRTRDLLGGHGGRQEPRQLPRTTRPLWRRRRPSSFDMSTPPARRAMASVEGMISSASPGDIPRACDTRRARRAHRRRRRRCGRSARPHAAAPADGCAPASERAGPLSLTLHQRLLGQLAQVVCGHLRALSCTFAGSS